MPVSPHDSRSENKRESKDEVLMGQKVKFLELGWPLSGSVTVFSVVQVLDDLVGRNLSVGYW